MAEDTNPTARVETAKPTDGTQIPDEDAGGFHYYSGGDVKELADTRVSPWLWGFWTIVLIGAVFLGLSFGALGPKSGLGYKPVDGGAAGLAKVQADLDKRGPAGVSVINLAAIDLPQGVTLKSAISDGEGIYQNKCIGCHGPNQDGNGVNAAALNPKPRNLRDAPFIQSMSYQRISTSLHKGVPGTAMPRWEGTLTDDDIKQVIAYVWSLNLTPKDLAAAEGEGTGGSSEQVSPQPITPAVNGDPAAHTNTAPPSASGAPTAQPSSQTTGTGPQVVSPIPNNPANADAGGQNAPAPSPIAQPTPASSGPSAGAGAPAASH